MRNLLLLGLITLSLKLQAQVQLLDAGKRHLRNHGMREWTSFPVEAEASELNIQFRSKKNAREQTLSLVQFDVKQDWKIFLNDKLIGALDADEKRMIKYYAVPAGLLRNDENKLLVKTSSDEVDDIEISNVKLHGPDILHVLSEATIEIMLLDADQKKYLPGRITILSNERVLQTVRSSSAENLAIRPGYIYTGDGKAILHLPAGSYTFYGGRGFEYGIDSVHVDLKPGDNVKKTLHIKREVQTNGWIASDTHIHTFTHSRHGDATLEERALTIAGEGIELPIMTDHNIYVDLKPIAERKNLLSYFKPVTGDELTTTVGHFNVFPTTVGTPVIMHQAENWASVTDAIADSSKIVILNHAQDIHNKFRPFDAAHHLSCAGTRSDGWKIPVNAMEVINSGSQQTDIMQLYHDWFGLLNHGVYVTPVGSSDSHDVGRFTVGQGRTYIHSDSDDPATLNVDDLVQNFREGQVMVSLGLLPTILVNEKYGPGDLVISSSNEVAVSLKILGPSWTEANKISLYANGQKIREKQINISGVGGVKWDEVWTLPIPAHDIFLVAIAEGPGEGMPYWPIAKPYQPASTEWIPHVFGSTGAVWIDGDKDGKRSSAFDYAKQIVGSAENQFAQIIQKLSSYDEAVAIQVAALLWQNDKTLDEQELTQALSKAAPQTQSGFKKVKKSVALIKK